MTGKLNLDTSRLDALRSQLGINTEQLLRALAFALEAQIKINNVPYDTGAMVNSVYTNTEGHDGYGAAASAANAQNPGVETSPIPAPEGKIVATVGVGVNYAIFVELGTSKMGARPFFLAPCEAMRRRFNDGKTWREIVNP
jgi:hypothetical protein